MIGGDLDPTERRSGRPGTVGAHNGWILIECSDPWGNRPAATSALLPPELRAAAHQRGLRIQLVRRTGHPPTGDGVTCVLASAAGAPVMEKGVLTDARAVLRLPVRHQCRVPA
jgi:hypothetical protein